MKQQTGEFHFAGRREKFAAAEDGRLLLMVRFV
jgi:hypothetical protein